MDIEYYGLVSYSFIN